MTAHTNFSAGARPGLLGAAKRENERPEQRVPPWPENGRNQVTPEDDELSRLVRRCEAGDEAALHRIYLLQAARLKGLAMRITGSAALAEDVLHDVFLRVWREADRFDPARGRASAWLTMLTRFRAMDVVRARGAAPVSVADEHEISLPEQLDLAMERSDQRRLRDCLDQLDPTARHAVVLAFVEGRTHVQIAEMTAMKLGTLKSLIRRSLRKLRGCMDG